MNDYEKLRIDRELGVLSELVYDDPDKFIEVCKTLIDKMLKVMHPQDRQNIRALMVHVDSELIGIDNPNDKLNKMLQLLNEGTEDIKHVKSKQNQKKVLYLASSNDFKK